MKALVLREYNRLSYEDVPRPRIGPDEVLVSVRTCGICGSDVHGMDGSTGRRLPPIIMGHEAAGIVAELGSKVRDWQKGDRVTFDSTISCGECDFCRQGRVNLCDRRRVLGVSCDDYRQDGAFAQFVAVPQRILYRLPEGIPFEHAAMVEALSIAFHAVRRTPVTRDDMAAVIGAGMIGLLIVQSLRLAGCQNIISVDIEPSRLELARLLGAHEVVDASSSNPGEELRRLSSRRGLDLAYEAVGIADTIGLAVRCVRKGGAIVLVGNVAPQVPLPLQAAVTRELTLYGSCASNGEYPACLEAMAAGTVRVAPLISAVAPLQEGPSWFERLYRREKGLLKVVLEPGAGD